MEINFRHPHFRNRVKIRRQPCLREEVRAAGSRYRALTGGESEPASRRDSIILRDAAKERRKIHRRKRNRLIRRAAAIVSAAAIIAGFAFTIMPSTGKTAYALRQLKSETVATAIESGFDAPENYVIAVGEEIRANEQRKITELENVFTLAESKLGCKYVHSTAGPYTFDCQGYVHYIFTHCDANVLCYVPRGGCANQLNAIRQYQISDNPGDARRGDIVYFYGGGRWKHVGIAMGNGKLIHATTIGPGRACVKITDMPDWYDAYAVVRVLG